MQLSEPMRPVGCRNGGIERESKREKWPGLPKIEVFPILHRFSCEQNIRGDSLIIGQHVRILGACPYITYFKMDYFALPLL